MLGVGLSPGQANIAPVGVFARQRQLDPKFRASVWGHACSTFNQGLWGDMGSETIADGTYRCNQMILHPKALRGGAPLVGGLVGEA